MARLPRVPVGRCWQLRDRIIPYRLSKLKILSNCEQTTIC
jgi:hypothetical protein